MFVVDALTTSYYTVSYPLAGSSFQMLLMLFFGLPLCTGKPLAALVSALFAHETLKPCFPHRRSIGLRSRSLGDCAVRSHPTAAFHIKLFSLYSPTTLADIDQDTSINPYILIILVRSILIIC